MKGSDPFQIYQQMQVKTLSQGKLILMLYDGAIRFLREAIKNMGTRDFEQANNNLIKAQDIINELSGTLNMDAGPVARDLFRLYQSMNNFLVQANIKSDSTMAERVIKMLENLKSAWETIILQPGQTGGAASA